MINKLINGIRVRLADPFWKNVVTLFSGSALAQALPILILPVITRLYSKEALGFYFVYAAIGMLTQIVASFQYQLAILLPKDIRDANKILVLNIVLVGASSLVMGIFVLVFFNVLQEFIEQKNFVKWLYLVPLSTLFLGFFNALSYYFNRIKNYKQIAYGKFSKALISSLFQIIFGFIGFLKGGLIVGLVLGQFASSLYLLIILYFQKDFTWRINRTELKTLFFKYKDIPLFNTLISFLNTLSNQLPLFLLTRFFGATSASDYGLANRIVTTPMGLIGQSVGQVFYQEAAGIFNKNENLLRIVKTTYLRLFKLGLVPFLIFALFAPWLFKMVFSTDYETSGIMTRLLIPWLFVMFLNSPITYIITVLNKQRQMLVYDTVLLIVRFLALFSGYYFFNNLFVTIGLFSLVGLIMNLFLLAYFIYLSKKPISSAYD